MKDKILVVDLGSPYTQLIAQKVRSLQIYCEICPGTESLPLDKTVCGIILSGSLYALEDANALHLNIKELADLAPVLGIGLGAQLVIKEFGGTVTRQEDRQFAEALLKVRTETPLFAEVTPDSVIWMEEGISIKTLPEGFSSLAFTDSGTIAAFSRKKELKNPVFGLQFHPEVHQSKEGKKVIKNFLLKICHASKEWTPKRFAKQAIQKIKEEVGDEHVVMALSGGVDSTVSASLIKEAIGDRLTAVFVNTGLLRKNEFEKVLNSYKTMQFNVIGVDAAQRYYEALKGVTDPEKKRKIIGGLFIDIFQEQIDQLGEAAFLGQGTIYPDVLESVAVEGASVKVKSHHNVGGLPEKMNLKLIEPLRDLFKDEVRKIGKEIGIPESFLKRHPFPGPGLGIRILGAITPQRVQILQEADDIYVSLLKKHGWYDKVWQAGAILLPVQSVGVKGDQRTYEFTVALRAVNSSDGMTAEWGHLPYHILEEISNTIINQVDGVNRVVYDISSKPPATIEWE